MTNPATGGQPRVEETVTLWFCAVCGDTYDTRPINNDCRNPVHRQPVKMEPTDFVPASLLAQERERAGEAMRRAGEHAHANEKLIALAESAEAALEEAREWVARLLQLTIPPRNEPGLDEAVIKKAREELTRWRNG